MMDAARRKPHADLPRLCRRLWPQTMIDGQRQDRATVRPGPIVHQKRESEAIGTAGNANRDQRLRFEPPEGRQRRSESGRIDR